MRLIKATEAAELLGLDNAKQVYEAASKRMIPAVRIGRKVRFDPDALRGWAEKGGTKLGVQNIEAQNTGQSFAAEPVAG